MRACVREYSSERARRDDRNGAAQTPRVKVRTPTQWGDVLHPKPWCKFTGPEAGSPEPMDLFFRSLPMSFAYPTTSCDSETPSPSLPASGFLSLHQNLPIKTREPEACSPWIDETHVAPKKPWKDLIPQIRTNNGLWFPSRVTDFVHPQHTR